MVVLVREIGRDPAAVLRDPARRDAGQPRRQGQDPAAGGRPSACSCCRSAACCTRGAARDVRRRGGHRGHRRRLRAARAAAARRPRTARCSSGPGAPSASDPGPRGRRTRARRCTTSCWRAAATLAVAESLTGGLLGGHADRRAGRLRRRSAAGSSPTRPSSRRDLLGVPADLLERHGAGAPDWSRPRWRPVRGCGSARRTAWRRPGSPDRTRRTGTRRARSTSGWRGGEPLRLLHRRLDLTGDRATVRAGTVLAALGFLHEVLTDGNAAQ